MSRIEIAPELGGDFDRIFDYIARYDVDHAAARIRDIINAFNVLETNPLIGRPASSTERELVIGRGTRGYVALYRYVAEIDTVFILALRNQREAGYKRS